MERKRKTIRKKKIFRKKNRNTAHKKKQKKIKTPKRVSFLPIVYGHIFSSQCIHCIQMQPEWDKLVQQVTDIELRDIGDNYEENILNINKEFNCNLQFNGVPTIYKIMQKGGNVEYYYNERTCEAMKSWLYSPV